MSAPHERRRTKRAPPRRLHDEEEDEILGLFGIRTRGRRKRVKRAPRLTNAQQEEVDRQLALLGIRVDRRKRRVKKTKRAPQRRLSPRSQDKLDRNLTILGIRTKKVKGVKQAPQLSLRVPMALCLTCSNSNYLHSSSTHKAGWLEKNNRKSAIPPNAPPPSAKPFYPKDSSVRIKITIGGPDRKVLYWGAQARSISSPIPSALKAYGSYSNMGISRVKNGVLSLLCQAPRPYHEDGKTWPCHIHYVNPSSDLKSWQPKVYAIAALPGHHRQGAVQYSMTCLNRTNPKCSIVTPEYLYRNWNKFIVVNALPEDNKNIVRPGSSRKVLHVPCRSSDEVVEKASKLIQDKPYVVYCMHSKCNAATVLMERLNATGAAKNIYYMPSGKLGWTRMLNKLKKR